MSYKTDHPEQDPAEGSRDVIDRELARRAKEDAAADRKDQPSSGSRSMDKSGPPE